MKTTFIFFAVLISLLWLSAQAPDEQTTAEDVARFEHLVREVDAAETRLQRAAAALCQADEGPGSTHAWTADGHLVCHPATLPSWPRNETVQLATGSQL